MIISISWEKKGEFVIEKGSAGDWAWNERDKYQVQGLVGCQMYENRAQFVYLGLFLISTDNDTTPEINTRIILDQNSTDGDILR